MNVFGHSSHRCVKSFTRGVSRILTRGNSSTCNAKGGKGGKADLRSVVAEKIKSEQERIKKFVKEHGNTKVGEVKISQIYGGMRGIPALLCETSILDPQEGIRFRGRTIPECQNQLPKAQCGDEPLPEAIFWLLLTADVPTAEQAKMITDEWNAKGELPDYVKKMLDNLPKDLHPMSQFSMAVTSLNKDSQFQKAYHKGVKRTEFWKYSLEDGMTLLAKLPNIAARIYRNVYRDGKGCDKIDKDLDWSGNFARMLGFYDPFFSEVLRLYLYVHSDHDSGNVSSHTTHLVASALSDPFLSYAAGLNGLAGPLHGLANQQVLVWIEKMQKELGSKNPPEEKVKEYVQKTLKSGQIIPGYGHAILRKTDPRYLAQQEFAEKYLPKFEMYQLVRTIDKVVPPILQSHKKVRNPWANVDAHSGVLLQYYGLKEMQYYTVLFGVSRAIGVMASTTWHRALQIPIERPKSFTSDALMEMAKSQAGAQSKGAAKEDKKSKKV